MGYSHFTFGKNTLQYQCWAEETEGDCPEGYLFHSDMDFYSTEDTCNSSTSAGCSATWGEWSTWGSCERPYPQGWHARTRTRTSDTCVDDLESIECVPTMSPTESPSFAPSDSPTFSPTTFVDCMGVTLGDAQLDACGVCTGGTSGNIENGTMDCSGTCSGAAFLDFCGVCVGGTTGLYQNSTTDCNGDCSGTAFVNACGECVDGATGLSRTQGMDCAGVCGGYSSTDECGVCNTLPYTSRVKDCHGTCFGTAAYDDCGLCSGGNTGILPNAEMDQCGVCNGDGSSCAGCDGVPNSGVVEDFCGNCPPSSTCNVLSVDPPVIERSATVMFVVTTENTGITASSTGLTCSIEKLDENDPCQVYPGDERLTIVSFSPPAPWTKVMLLVQQNGNVVIYPFIYFYDEPTPVTAVAPSSIPLNTEVNITFTSSDFAYNTSDTGHMVCRFTFHDASEQLVPAYLDTDNSYAYCTFPAQSNSFQAIVVLSMDGGSSPTETQTYTTYASAPQIVAYNYQANMNYVLIEFDVPIAIADTSAFTNCYDILVVENVFDADALGENPLCTWDDYSTLRLQFGASAYTELREILTLHDNMFGKRDEAYPNYLFPGYFRLKRATNPVSPSVRIHGPQTVASCSSYFDLDASYSTGHGSRAMEYLWSSSSSVTFLTANTNDVLRVDTSSMPVDTEVEFELMLTNFHSESANGTFSVTVASTYYSVLLEGPSEVARSESFFLYANVQPCGGSVSVLTYSWAVDDAAVPLASEADAALHIPAQTLEAGKTYTFSVTVSDGASDTTVTPMQVSVVASDLVAVIAGGSRTVTLEDEVSLDCLSESYDPDGSYGTLRCDWTCMNGLGNCMSETSQSILAFGSGNIVVSASDLKAGDTYRFTATVFKGSRATSTWVEITVTASANVVVDMSGPAIPQRVDVVNEIVASFEAFGEHNVTWGCDDNTADHMYYEGLGAGFCKGEDGADILAYDIWPIDYADCEYYCTQADGICVGIYHDPTSNLCRMYGVAERTQLTFCTTSSYHSGQTFCSNVTGVTGEIVMAQTTPTYGFCYAKRTPLSYMDVSGYSTAFATHANGRSYSKLIIPKDSFQQGKTYLLTVQVENGTHSGRGGFLISSLSVPQSGRLAINGITNTEIAAVEWTHINFPITYHFGLFDSQDIFWRFGTQNHWSLDHGYIFEGDHKLKVCVTDRFDAQSEYTLNVTGGAIADDISVVVENVVNVPKITKNWKRLLFGAYLVDSAIQGLGESERSAHSQTVYDALEYSADQLTTNDERLDLLGSVARINHSYINQTVYMSKIDSLVTALTAMETFTIKQVLYRSNLLLQSGIGEALIRELDEKVLQLAFLTLRHGQVPFEFQTDTVKLVAMWDLENVPGGSTVAVDFGASFAEQFGAWDCDGVLCFGVKAGLLYYARDMFTALDDLWMNTADGQIVSDEVVRMALVNPNTNSYVNGTDLTTPITVTFTLSETANTTHYLYHCALWDPETQLWYVHEDVDAVITGNSVACEFYSYSVDTSVLSIVRRLKTPSPTPFPSEDPTLSPTDCVQAGVGQWSEWTECVDHNNRTRFRLCDNPAPTCWWKNCTESLVDTNCCTFDSYYGEWSDWTNCTYRGEGFFGTGEYVHRTRNCTNPYPGCGTRNCSLQGPDEEWSYCGTTLEPTTTSPSVAPTNSPTELPQGPCEEDWTYFKANSQNFGSCYHRIDQSLNRSDALARCISFGNNASLASPQEADENLVVSTFCDYSKLGDCWISVTAGGFEFFPGSVDAYPFSNWHSSVDSNNIQCGFYSKSAADEHWYSADCGELKSALCEIVFDGCIWPLTSNRITWDKGEFGVTYYSNCSSGYKGSIERECTTDGWLDAVDNCVAEISGVWVDDTGADGYGWSDTTVTNGKHGPFQEGADTYKTFTVSESIATKPYLNIQFSYEIVTPLSSSFQLSMGGTVLWTAPTTAAGSYSADFIVTSTQLGLSVDDPSFVLTFGFSARRRALSTGSGVTFAGLTLQGMTREEVTNLLCVNEDAYRQSDYYVMFDSGSSGFTNSSLPGYISMLLQIPRYFYDIEIGFENALDDFGGYNLTREYPQVNATSPTSERTYWNSDLTADSNCGNETWTADIPWTVFVRSGGVLSLDAFSNGSHVTEAGLYYLYGSILTVSVTEAITQTHNNSGNIITWSTTKRQKYAFPFVVQFAREIPVSVQVTVPECPANSTDCTLVYVAAMVDFSAVVRDPTDFLDVGTVQIEVKTKVAYPYIFITGQNVLTEPNFLPPSVAYQPVVVDDITQSVDANITFVSEVASTCTFEHDDVVNTDKICEQEWQLNLTPTGNSCYCTGTYIITFYARCFYDRAVCYFHESNGLPQNEAVVSIDVVTNQMCPQLIQDIALSGTMCETGTDGINGATCIAGDLDYMQGDSASFAVTTTSATAVIQKTEVVEIGATLDLDAIQALDVSDRPRYDYSFNGRNAFWTESDGIPGEVSWSDSYGSMTLPIVENVTNSDAWGDPSRAAFTVSLNQYMFPSSFSSYSTVEIYCVFRVTYEGMDGIMRRRLNVQRDRLAVDIKVHPLSELHVEDFTEITGSSDVNVDVKMTLKATRTLFQDYSKDPSSFMRRLEYILTQAVGCVHGEIQVTHMRFDVMELQQKTEVFDIDLLIHSYKNETSSLDTASNLKFVIQSGLIHRESLLKDTEFYHLVLRPRLTIGSRVTPDPTMATTEIVSSGGNFSYGNLGALIILLTFMIM